MARQWTCSSCVTWSSKMSHSMKHTSLQPKSTLSHSRASMHIFTGLVWMRELSGVQQPEKGQLTGILPCLNFKQFFLISTNSSTADSQQSINPPLRITRVTSESISLIGSSMRVFHSKLNNQIHGRQAPRNLYHIIFIIPAKCLIRVISDLRLDIWALFLFNKEGSYESDE